MVERGSNPRLRVDVPPSVKKVAWEWRITMPVLSSSIALFNSESTGDNPFLSILLAGGVSFLAGVIMKEIEKDDPKREKRWLRKGR